jgi:hypothetical protein
VGYILAGYFGQKPPRRAIKAAFLPLFDHQEDIFIQNQISKLYVFINLL